MRLSAILQALHDSFDFITKISKEKFELNDNFSKELETYLHTNPHKIIFSENVERGYKLLEYFNKNKLTLAGYEIDDLSKDIKEIFFTLIEKTNTQGPKKPYISVCKYVLSDESKILKLNDINQKIGKTVNIKIVEEACKDMSQNGFG